VRVSQIFAAWLMVLCAVAAARAEDGPGGLPASVASLPAVVALQRNDPATFEQFRKRYVVAGAKAGKDEKMTIARNVLRKSVKHLIANAPGDVLIDITEASLDYLQGLQASNPESCVWFSDETKGANLTIDLAREMPAAFSREMSVLERVASVDPRDAVAPLSDEEVRPYYQELFAGLRRQNIRTELQARRRLAPAEFAPFCAMVIAFYGAVLDLPHDDKVNVLRHLYSKADRGGGR
jgi:hypothetical protein